MKTLTVLFLALLFVVSGSVSANEAEPEYINNNDGSITLKQDNITIELLTELPDDDMGIQTQEFNNFELQSSTSNTPKIICGGSPNCSRTISPGTTITFDIEVTNADVFIWSIKNTSHCTTNKRCRFGFSIPEYVDVIYIRLNAIAFKDGEHYDVVKYLTVRNSRCSDFPGDMCIF